MNQELHETDHEYELIKDLGVLIGEWKYEFCSSEIFTMDWALLMQDGKLVVGFYR